MARALLIALALIAALGLATESRAAEAQQPRVVATIKPIDSLVAMVMQGAGEPHLLIAAGASPHTYSLKPSDAQALQQADVLFWVGEGLETFLEKPLRALPEKAKVVELAHAPGVTLLPYRAEGPGHADADDDAGGHEGHHDADADGHGHGHTHAAGSPDMHIWLDPANAQAIVRAVAAALTEADAGRAELYRSNAEQAVDRLQQLDATLRQQLTPLAGRAYIVFHDAYQYLEHRYGLQPLGAVTVSPERQPSARRIATIRDAIVASGAVCVFAEPQFPPKLVQTLTEGTPARTGVLDAEGGAAIPAGPGAYPAIMLGLADALRDCLAPAG